MTKVGGLYNDGRIIESKLICGISKGLVDFYQMYENASVFKAILLFQVDAHFMDITRFFYKGFNIKFFDIILAKLFYLY